MTDAINRNNAPRLVNAAIGNAPGTTVRVSRGDSLGKIATSLGVSVDALVEANKHKYPQLATNRNALQEGWKLIIPGPGGGVAQPAQPTWQPRTNDAILMVGMNPEGAAHEARHLRSRGNTVTLLTDAKKNVDDRVTKNGVTYDLDTPEGSLAFALTLGLPAEQTRQIANVIESGGRDAKDELAQLAQEWAKAERGGQIPSRMVFSGHSSGYGVWGDENGTIDMGDLAKLAEAMPRAARSVEDLMMAACSSAGEAVMENYRSIFPNLKTVWAYTDSAPGAVSGATAHMTRWDRSTKGNATSIDRELAAGTRKGENVAVWSVERGYLDGHERRPLADRRAAVTAGQETYERFLSGDSVVDSPSDGPLREHYNNVQRVLQHPDLPRAERGEYEAARDTTLRLLYFTKTVAPRFQQAHATAIRDGFTALGLPVPDFKTTSRAEALKIIADYEKKFTETQPPPETALRLLPLLTEGLVQLKTSRIPDGWV